MSKFKNIYKNCAKAWVDGSSKYVAVSYNAEGKVTKVTLICASKKEQEECEPTIKKVINRGVNTGMTRVRIKAIADKLAGFAADLTI